MTKIELATETFEKGYSCSQVVFYAFAEELGIDPNTALKVACGFGAGFGRNQEVCGAVSGGVMALGMKYGRGLDDGAEAKDLTYSKTREFIQRFTETNGAFTCRDLLQGIDLQTEQGAQQFKENNYSKTICAPCVQSAVRIIESMMA